MNKMVDFLNRITLGQLTGTAFLVGITNWLIDNEIVLLLTFITISVAALLAIKKLVITAINDIKWAIDFIKKRWD